jgi:hypothetical protein
MRGSSTKWIYLIELVAYYEKIKYYALPNQYKKVIELQSWSKLNFLNTIKISQNFKRL